jgi:hypothetical protein
MKNFGKMISTNLALYAPIASKLLGAESAGYNIYNNLSKLDDPKASVRDKTQDVIKAAFAPVPLVPGVGTVIANVGNAVVDSAGYIQDVLEGRRDPPLYRLTSI